MSPEEQHRGFKGVWIDKNIWLDSRLNALDKIILVEIDSLDNDNGCFASNKYIADFCQCSESKVSKSITKLISLGYLVLKSFNGRTRVLQSCLVKNARQTSTKSESASEKMPAININNNKDNISKESKEEPAKPTQYDLIISENFPSDWVEAKDALYEFIKMRKFIKNPLTDRALILLIKNIKQYSNMNEQTAIEILNRSIINNWKGIFPLKQEYQKKPIRQLTAQEQEFIKELEDDVERF